MFLKVLLDNTLPRGCVIVFYAHEFFDSMGISIPIAQKG